MENLVQLADMQKLSSAKKESILSAAKHVLSGKGVKAAKESKKANDAVRAKYTVGGAGPTQRMKDTAKADQKVLNKERLKTHGSRAALAGGAILTGAALAKALKRGGQSVSKKNALIKAMKKNPKTTAAVAGGTGVAGLASMLNK